MGDMEEKGAERLLINSFKNNELVKYHDVKCPS